MNKKNIWYIIPTMFMSYLINSLKNKTLKVKDIIWVVILQYVFCADVVATIIYYLKLKNAIKGENNYEENTL